MKALFPHLLSFFFISLMIFLKPFVYLLAQTPPADSPPIPQVAPGPATKTGAAGGSSGGQASGGGGQQVYNVSGPVGKFDLMQEYENESESGKKEQYYIDPNEGTPPAPQATPTHFPRVGRLDVGDEDVGKKKEQEYQLEGEAGSGPKSKSENDNIFYSPEF